MTVLLRSVALRNYKSIAKCRVELSNLTLLVGPNGAGKSNFIDALRMVSESLNATLEYAIRQRGGIGEVRRRSGGHPNHFAISLRIGLPSGGNGHFAFQVGAQPEGAFYVQREQASVSATGLQVAFYEVEGGKLIKASSELDKAPQVTNDRLFLTTVSGVSAFRGLYDALASMGFYNINPEDIREPQVHDRGDILSRSGSNLAAVIKRMSEEDSSSLARIQDYLRRIVPGIEGVDYKQVGPRETLEFRQKVAGQQHPWRFYASAMSDGTLRSLGVLTALFQSNHQPSRRTSLVAIEEPESTIHPGAAAVLMDALMEASRKEQIIATTHSPDLLDHKSVGSNNLFGVKSVEGETVIAPVDRASMSAIRDSLQTAGELLRQGQLQPDVKTAKSALRQSDLFERL
jgi:predicted ATPase